MTQGLRRRAVFIAKHFYSWWLPLDGRTQHLEQAPVLSCSVSACLTVLWNFSASIYCDFVKKIKLISNAREIMPFFLVATAVRILLP